MVEREIDSIMSDIIQHIEDNRTQQEPPATVGGGDHRTVAAAIKIMAHNLEKTGIRFDISRTILSKTMPETNDKPPDDAESKKVEAPHDTRLVAPIVEIGLLGAMNAGIATLDSVGKASTTSALVPGNIVAFHNPWENKFIRIYNTVADYGDTPNGVASLPYVWSSERFLVVDAGHGCVAFFNPCSARFLNLSEDGTVGASDQIRFLDDRPRGNESFVMKNTSSCGGSGSLYCPSARKCVHGSAAAFSIVQIAGFGSTAECGL